ncbi:MAG: pitrilysin family protein [Bdellovibrionota bacterium]
MKKNAYCFVLFFLGAFASEHVWSAQLKVPYESYELDNGLKVILHQDRSIPKVVVNTWYRVGSKNEMPGRTGFAHLFEHLMFMGTKNVPNGQYDILMEQFGGTNNASTSNDWTNYYNIGANTLLPTFLWLEADRMNGLGMAVDQQKLDLQRKVVRNERRQSYEIQPYGMGELTLIEHFFPEKHVYKWPVIGSHQDLEAATVKDVKDFFTKWYVPNNATLVVAGDFDKKVAKKLIQKYYAWIPRGDTPHFEAAKDLQWPTSYQKVTIQDDVPASKLTIAFRSPPFYGKGDAEMDILSEILTEGEVSRLFQRLKLQNAWVEWVASYQDSMIEDSIFQIHTVLKPGVNVDVVQKEIEKELKNIQENGITKAELERVQAQYEASFLWKLESLADRADRLNAYQFYVGEPDYFQQDLQRYQSATVDSVNAIARQVFSTPEFTLEIQPGKKG